MARTLKYIRAQRNLLHLIAQEGIQPGDKLPSEKELVGKFRMSAISVRRALSELASQGVIETVQGTAQTHAGFVE